MIVVSVLFMRQCLSVAMLMKLMGGAIGQCETLTPISRECDDHSSTFAGKHILDTIYCDVLKKGNSRCHGHALNARYAIR